MIFLKDTLFDYKLFLLENQPPGLNKINWICNCVKHENGFPRLKDPPAQFSNGDKSKPIKIAPDEFGKDIEFMIKHLSEIFEICLLTGYADYAIKISRRMTHTSGKTTSDLEIQLKAALMARALILSGKEHIPEAVKRSIKEVKTGKGGKRR